MPSFDRDHHVFRVGLFAIAAVIVFIGMFFWITQRGFGGARSELFVQLPTAERLKEGDPVFFRGVRVGEVRTIDFAGGGVLVEVGLQREVPLSRAATAEMQAVDVFGAQSIVLRARQDRTAAGAALEDGDTIRGAANPTLTAQAERIADRAERLLGDTTVTLVRETLGETRRAAVELNDLLTSSQALLDRQQANVTATTRNLAAGSANLVAVSASLRETTGGGELKSTLANLQQATATLVGTTEQADSASASLARLLTGLEAGDGTAGRLLNDPALYEEFLRSSRALETLLTDLRENPERYVHFSLF